MSFASIPHISDADITDANGYLRLSSSPDILTEFRQTGRATVWSRELEPELNAAIKFLLFRRKPLLNNLHGTRYACRFGRGAVRLAPISNIDNSISSNAFLSNEIFPTARLRPIAEELEARIAQGSQLFNDQEYLRVRIHTLTTIPEEGFHIDSSFRVLGANYTEDGSELGPPEAFVASDRILGKKGDYKCIDHNSLRRLSAGDVGILCGPHRESVSPKVRYRLWMGVYSPT